MPQVSHPAPHPACFTRYPLPVARPAFTLVELLVVIGIIAVLVGILLPSLQAARRQANTLKCAAALREIGTCYLFYAQDNRGYAPPVRCNNYNIDGILYNATATDDLTANPLVIGTNAYWYHFLARYITRARGGASMSTADVASSILVRNSLIWGCPSFTPYVIAPGSPANLVGDVNRQYTGYGMNNWPTYTPSYPAAGTDFPNAPDEFVANSTDLPVTWYKLAAYTHPATRALTADSVWWSLECRAPNAAGTNMTCHNYQFNNGGMSGGNGSGQTNCDLFRHGRIPAETAGTTGKFATTGGKPAYNVLYADNHVVTETTRDAIYRATRQRFPR